MTCNVKGCPAPEHSLPNVTAITNAEWLADRRLDAAAPDMAHALAGLVEAANYQVANLEAIRPGSAHTFLRAAIAAAEAALRKAGGK